MLPTLFANGFHLGTNKMGGGGAYEKSELSTNLSVFLGIPNGDTVSHRKERFEKEGETKPGR